MTKTELLDHVTRRSPYLIRQDAEIIVDRIFQSMADALAQGDRVEIRGFGSFKVTHREARESRNPKTGESVYVPANARFAVPRL